MLEDTNPHNHEHWSEIIRHCFVFFFKCSAPPRDLPSSPTRRSSDLDAVPAAIDPEAVRRYLSGRAGVAELHDLHIWPMSTTETALTCHLVMPAGHPGDAMLAGLEIGRAHV